MAQRVTGPRSPPSSWRPVAPGGYRDEPTAPRDWRASAGWRTCRRGRAPACPTREPPQVGRGRRRRKHQLVVLDDSDGRRRSRRCRCSGAVAAAVAQLLRRLRSPQPGPCPPERNVAPPRSPRHHRRGRCIHRSVLAPARRVAAVERGLRVSERGRPPLPPRTPPVRRRRLQCRLLQSRPRTGATKIDELTRMTAKDVIWMAATATRKQQRGKTRRQRTCDACICATRCASKSACGLPIIIPIMPNAT